MENLVYSSYINTCDNLIVRRDTISHTRTKDIKGERIINDVIHALTVMKGQEAWLLLTRSREKAPVK